MERALGKLGPARFLGLEEFFLDNDFSPVSTKRRQARDVVAIGDCHGDLVAFLSMLHLGGCIDLEGNWTGASTHVVQVGDFLDRGGRYNRRGELISLRGKNPREEIDIMQYAWFLDRAAAKFGGSVTLLAGNHELFNFYHEFSCTTDVTNIGWGGLNRRAEWFSRGASSPLACYFAARHPAIVTIGSLVFVHGGIAELCLERTENFWDYVETVNSGWRRFLLDGEDLLPCVAAALSNRDMSDQFEGSASQCDEVAHTIFAAVKFPRRGVLVLGHTPQVAGYQQVAGINSVCGNSVWRVDIGASEAFGSDGLLQILKITDSKFFQVWK